MKDYRRKLESMPFDHDFGGTLCKATGFEACFAGDDPEDPANWWNEYVSPDGKLEYGR